MQVAAAGLGLRTVLVGWLGTPTAARHWLRKPDTIPPSPALNYVKSKEETTTFGGLCDRPALPKPLLGTNQFNGSLPFHQQEKTSHSVVKQTF